MVRKIPKARVAALAIEKGYLARLIEGASHSVPEVAGACSYFATWLADPSADIIDVDAPQWAGGRSVLIASGLFLASECDDIEALYERKPVWTFEGVVECAGEEFRAVFRSDAGVEASVVVQASNIDPTYFLSTMNEG
jgi:hypothetical protein